MSSSRIAIVGGGLSGLYTAYQLECKGITDYVLLEARDNLGGRVMDFSIASDIATKTSSDTDPSVDMDRFDLGPSWFWPNIQPQLDAVITQLNLGRFSQFEQGDMRVERAPNEAPKTVRGYASSPTSMRLKGGMGSLIRALYSKLNGERIRLSSRVKSISEQQGKISIAYSDTHGKTQRISSIEQVFLALPPRLAVEAIAFSPALPPEIVQQWQETETWMAPHAKYLAIYEQPFWREQGLSGDAQSAHGPVVEIHDASMPGGKAALFGFIGVPASYRKKIAEEEMKAHCRSQLVRLFGTEAATPIADTIKDWSQDPLTSTRLDLQASGRHSIAPKRDIDSGFWHQQLVGVGSEWSPQFPGYLAGAIEAADIGVQRYLNRAVQ